MSRRGKKSGKQGAAKADDRSDRRERILARRKDPAARRKEARTQGRQRPGKSRLWLSAKRPVLRFVLVFGILVGGFNVLFYLWLSDHSVFETYLNWNAALSGGFLRIMGEDVRVNGTAINGPRGALEIRRGCDAVQASAFFVFVVLASPLSMRLRARIPAILIGTGLLLLINLVRILSLYYTQVYWPSAFEMMHVEIWQAVFIFLPMFFWLVWLRRATRTATVSSNVG